MNPQPIKPTLIFVAVAYKYVNTIIALISQCIQPSDPLT